MKCYINGYLVQAIFRKPALLLEGLLPGYLACVVWVVVVGETLLHGAARGNHC